MKLLEKAAACAVAIGVMLVLSAIAPVRAQTNVFDLDNPLNAPYRETVYNKSCKSNTTCTLTFAGAGTGIRIVVYHATCGIGPAGPDISPISASLVNNKGTSVFNYMPILFNGLDMSTNPPASYFVVSDQTMAIFMAGEAPLIFVKLSDQTSNTSMTPVTCTLQGAINHVHEGG